MSTTRLRASVWTKVIADYDNGRLHLHWHVGRPVLRPTRRGNRDGPPP